MTHGRGYLLDTNVLSETRKSNMDGNVADFLGRIDESQVFLSALTFGEFRRGVEKKRATDPDGADRIEAWINEAEEDYADRILPVDVHVAGAWGVMSADRSRPVIDTLIAATAQVHNLVLITRNAKDVRGLPIRVLNPWHAAPRSRPSPKEED